ncbi:MAG: nuclear transport factor 2 family protein [Actinomycetota bacterium]
MAEKQTVVETAEQAFEHFTHGLATGEWEPFLEMLTTDFSFWFPVGQFQGQNVGKERAAAFFQYVSAAFQEGLKVKLERVTSHDRTVVFEFQSQGLLRGQPYQNQVAVSFDVQGDKICAYREYLAVVVSPTPHSR